MAGKRFLSHLQLGKETTAGTAVAATRRVFPEGSGILHSVRDRTGYDGEIVLVQPGHETVVVGLRGSVDGVRSLKCYSKCHGLRTAHNYV